LNLVQFGRRLTDDHAIESDKHNQKGRKHRVRRVGIRLIAGEPAGVMTLGRQWRQGNQEFPTREADKETLPESPQTVAGCPWSTELPLGGVSSGSGIT
jgi:hypothetical protein